MVHLTTDRYITSNQNSFDRNDYMGKNYKRNCKECSKVFVASNINRGEYCSLECKFWNNVEKSEDKNGCWIWKGKPNSYGYGRIFSHKKVELAHRYSYELNVGPIPEGKLICHHCDNPICTRSDHLFLGTYKDNKDDCVNKQRHKKKLSIKIVQSIMIDNRSHAEIAKEYNITKSAVSSIKTGRSWKYAERRKNSIRTSKR